MGEEIKMVSELWKGGDVTFAEGNIIQDNKENLTAESPFFFTLRRRRRGNIRRMAERKIRSDSSR